MERVKELFWNKVTVLGLDECWEWTASVQSMGYGQLSGTLSRTLSLPSLAHRAAYLITRGEIPKSLQVLHSCDNRKCCNPTHLWVGTSSDNMWDKSQKGRCGKPRRSRLPEEQLEQIATSSKLNRVLALEYGISNSRVQKIKSRRKLKNK